jgi:diguanylate cyclase (GGDEF)-like protein
MLALMFIDLDQFRQITDEHGFETGDLVLRAIAERLREVLRNTDTLCRVSADEFAAILPNIQDLIRYASWQSAYCWRFANR